MGVCTDTLSLMERPWVPLYFQPSANLSEELPDDSLGVCLSARLGKRKSSLDTKVPPTSLSAYLTVAVYYYGT